MTYFPPKFRTQFDGGPYANQNCGPTSGAMAAYQSTAGDVDLSGSQMRALIPVSEETNPMTPGWSMVDLDRAMGKLGVSFTAAGGQTWRDAAARHGEGRGIVFQGDSDQFLAGCSAAFDGDHSIYWPASDDETLIGDPICREFTHQPLERIRAYAEKYGRTIFGTTDPQKISFGYTARVPEEEMDAARFAPVALCAVRSGGALYADPDRHTLIAANWPGGTSIQLYALPVTPVVDGRSELAPIRYDRLGGPAEDLMVAYIGADLISNVRLINDTTPYSQAELDAAHALGATEREAVWERWVATHP